jgi:hypothetical protein
MKNLEKIKSPLFEKFKDYALTQNEMSKVIGAYMSAGTTTQGGAFQDGTKYCRDFADNGRVNSVHLEGTSDCDGQMAGSRDQE